MWHNLIDQEGATVRFPYTRLAQLYDLLRQTPLPQDELPRRFHVSSRTIRSDLTLLNEVLAAYGAQFVLQRKIGYQLIVHQPERFAGAQSQTGLKPRTAEQRVQHILLELLLSDTTVKLQNLADEWYISRAALQLDMVKVRDWLAQFELSIESRPHYGMTLVGNEAMLRLALSHLIEQVLTGQAPQLSNLPPLLAWLPARYQYLQGIIQQVLADNSKLRITDEGKKSLVYYCAVTLERQPSEGVMTMPANESLDEEVARAAEQICQHMTEPGRPDLSEAEWFYIGVYLSAHRMRSLDERRSGMPEPAGLVEHILGYIQAHYGYLLAEDQRLVADLTTHIKTMMIRLRYRIHLVNPVLQDIKHHYAMAYDLTLAAVANWSKQSHYQIQEDEMGYLVLHIGVALQRRYQLRKSHRVLLVCDRGVSTANSLEAQLKQVFPHVKVIARLTLEEYRQWADTEVDLVVTTVPVAETFCPVLCVAAFPTAYQINQLAQYL